MQLQMIENAGLIPLTNETINVDDDDLRYSGLALERQSVEEMRLAYYAGLSAGWMRVPQLVAHTPSNQLTPFNTATLAPAMNSYQDRQGDSVMVGTAPPEDAYQAVYPFFATDPKSALVPYSAPVNYDGRMLDNRKRDQMEVIPELYSGTGALVDIDKLKKTVERMDSTVRDTWNQTWILARRFKALDHYVRGGDADHYPDEQEWPVYSNGPGYEPYPPYSRRQPYRHPYDNEDSSGHGRPDRGRYPRFANGQIIDWNDRRGDGRRRRGDYGPGWYYDDGYRSRRRGGYRHPRDWDDSDSDSDSDRGGSRSPRPKKKNNNNDDNNNNDNGNGGRSKGGRGKGGRGKGGRDRRGRDRSRGRRRNN